MKAQQNLAVSIAGSGNAGTFLATRLFESGCVVKQVFSRTLPKAQKLAERVSAGAVNDIAHIDQNIDLLIIALPDNVIPEFCQHLSELKRDNELAVVSVAGSVNLNKISRFFTNAGVLYPVQSFTLLTNPDPAKIPICIEATNQKTERLITEVSKLISDDVRYLDSNQRQSLHLAAVFASNFTNHMIAIADELLEKAKIEQDILMPLIHETINRLEKNDASLVQTGPAIRKDLSTIEKHIALLESTGDKRLKEIYYLISENIQNFAERIKNT